MRNRPYIFVIQIGFQVLNAATVTKLCSLLFFIYRRNKFMVFECLISPPLSLIKKGKWYPTPQKMPASSIQVPFLLSLQLCPLATVQLPYRASVQMQLSCEQQQPPHDHIWTLADDAFSIHHPLFFCQKKDQHTVLNI